MSLSPFYPTDAPENLKTYADPRSPEGWKVLDRFDSTYWSGQDVKYYADSVRLDEVIQLSFQISERVTPYFGYADFIAQRLVHGQRVIAGELTVNLKRYGWMFSLLDILRRNTEGGPLVPDTAPRPPFPVISNDWGLFAGEGSGQRALLEGKLSGEMLSQYVQDARQRELATGRNPIGQQTSTVAGRSGLFDTGVRGFDINIIFGSGVRNELALRFDPNGNSSVDTHRIADRREDGYRIATGMKIEGVSISGTSQTIGDDGRPIMETYSFMAKNVRPLDIESPTEGRITT